MRTLYVLAALAIAVVFATLALPFLHSGFPLGHDLPAHLTYTYLFDRAFEAGQFPVRWTQGVRAGDSQPLFNFYQPGFYYVVQLVHVGVDSLGASMKLAVLALWAAGAAWTFRLHAHRGWLPAAFGAAVFAGSPYLLLDVNVRSAYPEFAAIACAVGALAAIAALFASPGAGRAAWLGCLLAGALVCHLPATLVFTPVLVASAVRAGLDAADPRRAWRWCAAAVLLAAGLSAFYVMPALGERHLIRMDALTAGYFDYQHHFVEPWQWLRFDWGFGASVPGPADGMSFQVGVVQWLVVFAALACALAAAIRRRVTRDDRDLVFWLAVVAFALFMTTAVSAPLWRAVPQLAYLQFPWRYLMLVAVACGALAANVLARLDARHARPLAVTAVVALQLAASADQRRPDRYLPRRAMDIDRPNWAATPEAQRDAFVEPGYSPAGRMAALELRDSDLRRVADASTVASGALLVVLISVPRRRRVAVTPARAAHAP